MCPDGVKVARLFQTDGRFVAHPVNNQIPSIPQSARRVFIRFTAAVQWDPAAVDEQLRIFIVYDSNPVMIGVINPFNPTVELTFETHGQLVFGPFSTDSSLSQTSGVYIVEAIVTEDMAKV